MQPDTVRESLGLDASFDPWREGWAESEPSFLAQANQIFNSGRILKACAYLQFTPDCTDAMLAALDQLKQNEPLYRLAWHCHTRLFAAPFFQDVDFPLWPALPERLCPRALFYPLVFLSGLPITLALHRQLGIDESITRDTLSDLDLWMRHHRQARAEWGLTENDWISNHFRGRIYKLGRLQFMMERFQLDFTAFQRNSDGAAVVLAPDQATFRDDGQFNGADGRKDNENTWTAAVCEDGQMIAGAPVSPDGRAVRAKILLDRREWRRVLARNDRVLSVHVPATGPMDDDACEASFKNAVQFFRKYFPAHACKGFTCHSWLLDHQLERYLPPTSSIVQFLGHFYILPFPDASQKQTLERVFGADRAPAVLGPGATSLQRHVVAHIEGGGCWRDAMGLRFPEHLARGGSYYRETFQQLLLTAQPGGLNQAEPIYTAIKKTEETKCCRPC